MATIDIYARVSRASDKRDLSTNGQVSEGREDLERRGYELGEMHVDSSFSAWNTRVRRPGWDHLMVRLESGTSDGAWIFELSRFARRAEDGLRLLRLAQKGLILIDSEGEYDLTRPKQAKNFRDAISAAEYESDMISLRTRRGKRHKARELAQPNTSTRAFGFELGGIVPREIEAEELRWAAEQLIAGADQSAICRKLNERGVLTSLGNPWKPPSLRVALLRPGNVGDIVHRGEVVHRAVYSGILGRDEYDRLVALYASRRRGRPTTNLATGFARCAACGRGMHAKELVRHQPYPNGEKARAYSCVKRDGGCGNTIDWLDLDEYLGDLAIKILSDPDRAQRIAAAINAVNEELAPVTQKITELETLAGDLAERLGHGDISLYRYDLAVKPLDEQLSRLRKQEAELRATAPDKDAARKAESEAKLRRRWEGAHLIQRRSIVKQALGGQRVLIAPGRRRDPANARCILSN